MLGNGSHKVLSSSAGQLTRKKDLFTWYVFFHIWAYLIIYNYYMHWVLVAPPTLCLYVTQPVCSFMSLKHFHWAIEPSFFWAWGYNSEKFVSSSPGQVKFVIGIQILPEIVFVSKNMIIQDYLITKFKYSMKFLRKSHAPHKWHCISKSII